MEVIHRETGEKRWIKAERFNPEFHKKLEDCRFGEKERLVKITPSNYSVDLSGLGEKEPQVENPIVEEAVKEFKATTTSPDIEVVISDILDDVKVDEVVNETDNLESLPMFKLRQLAKSKSIKFQPTMKKTELIALIRTS